MTPDSRPAAVAPAVPVRLGGRLLKSRPLIALLGLAASAVLLLLAARKLEWGDVTATLRSAEPAYVVAAGAALVAFYALQAARWAWIVRDHTRLGYRRFLSFVVAGVATNNVVPGRVGDLLRAHWLSRAAGLGYDRAFASVAVDRGSDVLVLVLALLVSYPTVSHPGWAADLRTSGAGAAVVLVAALVLARVYTRLTGRRDRRLPFRRGRIGSFVAAISGLVDRGAVVGAGALGVLAWTAWSLAAWLTARSLGIDVSVGLLVFTAAAMNLGVAIPSSPGFIGTYQWLAVAALALGGVGAAEAFAFSIVLHALWFVPTTLAGAVLAYRGLSWRRAPEGTRETDAA